jgi:hypothetical protein
MNDERLRGFGRLWANQRLQARPGFAWLVVLPPRPGLPEPERSAKSPSWPIALEKKTSAYMKIPLLGLQLSLFC